LPKIGRSLLLFLCLVIAITGFNYRLSLSGIKPVFAQEKFTLIALPDTQVYSQSYPEIFRAQTQWAVAQIADLKIAYLTNLGDIVNVSSNISQWENADEAISLLEDSATTGLEGGLPYGIVPGNHDQPTGNFNTYFGVSRFENRAYYGGHYGSNNDSNFTLFNAGGIGFISINFEYYPSSEIIQWADGLVKSYPDRLAIVVSHYLLDLDASFGAPGSAIYEALKDDPNLFLMLCGHNHGEARRTDTYQGNVVYSLLADYQGLSHGGNGWLRILEFDPAANKIQVKTYSPTLGQYDTDEESQFVLDYNFSAYLLPTATPNVEATPTPDPGCRSDIDHSHQVGIGDLLQMLKDYLFFGGDQKADVNNDGKVNGFDFGFVLKFWGRSCP